MLGNLDQCFYEENEGKERVRQLKPQVAWPESSQKHDNSVQHYRRQDKLLVTKQLTPVYHNGSSSIGERSLSGLRSSA